VSLGNDKVPGAARTRGNLTRPPNFRVNLIEHTQTCARKMVLARRARILGFLAGVPTISGDNYSTARSAPHGRSLLPRLKYQPPEAPSTFFSWHTSPEMTLVGETGRPGLSATLPSAKSAHAGGFRPRASSLALNTERPLQGPPLAAQSG